MAVLIDPADSRQQQSSRAIPVSNTDLLKRAAIALSIANLCFLFVWSEILHIASDRRFFFLLKTRPDPLFFWALLLDVLVLAAIIFSLLLLRKSGRRLLRYSATAILALLCLFALYQCRRSFNGALYSVISTRTIFELQLAIIAVIVLLILRWPRRALPGLRTFFLVLSPLFFVFAAQGLALYYGSGSRQYGPHLAGMLPKGISHNRAIWIIFDELDYRFLFENRPSRIQLSHFDELRRASLMGDRVKSPAHNTTSAMPSLLLARDIPGNDDIRLATRPVEVRFSGCSKFVSLPSQENVFRRARALGYNTAVSGWYHAYCRLFGGDLSACATSEGAGTALIPQQLLRNRPFLYKAAYLADWQARSLPLVQGRHWIAPMPDEARYYRQWHILQTEFVLRRGTAMLRNPQLNFVLLHLPVPHPPGIWDAHKQSFSTSDRLNYIDNLELADRILGQIRTTLEQSGDWDRSTILVSADHPYRPQLWLTGATAGDLSSAALAEMVQATHRKWQPYIPFFLKLPGQKTGIEYHREFNSVLSANLLLAALKGDIRTPSQAIQWLDAHAAASEQKVCR